MKKLFLLTLIFICVASVYAADGFVLGGDPGESYCFKENFGKSLNRVFDAKITFNTITNAQPLLSDKVAMVFDTNKIYAYGLTSGEAIWQFPKDAELITNINGKPTSYNGMVYFVTLDKLNCLDELTGKVIWKKNVPRSISPVLKVYNDVLYACCDDNNVYRINPETGDDIEAPINFSRGGNKNTMLINKDYLVVVEESFLRSYNFKTKKEFAIQIPATSANFSPILLDNYIIVTSGEQIFLFDPKNGKKMSQKKFPTAITSSSITDGQNIYVSCLDAKIYEVKLEKKLSKEFNGFPVPNSVKKLIAVNNNNILALDSNGLFFTYDLKTKSVVWQFQPGMYTQGGVQNTIPGIGAADITTETEFSLSNYSNSQGMGNGGPGGQGGRGGRGGRGGGPGGPGAFRAEGLDDFTNSIFSINGNVSLLAQGPMGGPGGQGGRGGRGGRNGRNGRNGEMGGNNTRNTVTKTINYVNVLKANGNVYDIDFDKFFNDPGREFIPSPVVSYPFYNNGYLGYISLDGHFRVRSLSNVDNIAPYTFEYTPGATAETKVISANKDILVKITVFDKGSGIDFKTASLICRDSNGKEYVPHLIYDPNKQMFCGYIRNNQDTSKIVPFTDGDFNCDFKVKDYVGNEAKLKIIFRIDSSIEPKDEFLAKKVYYDVETGNLIEVDGYDFCSSDAVLTNSSNNKSGSNGRNTSEKNGDVSSKGSGIGGVSNVADSSKKKSNINSNNNGGNTNNNTEVNNQNNNITSQIQNPTKVGEIVDGEYVVNGYNPNIIEVESNKVDTPKKESSDGEPQIYDENFYPPNPPKW